MKNFLFIFTIILFSLSLSQKALAASVLVSAPAHVSVGDNFKVLVSVDSGGELINSADITLDYDETRLSFSGYKNDNAVIGLWIASPHDVGGKIYMSGIIPGGVSGLYDPNKSGVSPVPLVELLFVAKEVGTAQFAFGPTKILKSDGKGTELAHDQKNGEVDIQKGNDGNLSGGAGGTLDSKPPLPFELTFLDSSFFSRTPTMVAFDAQDVDSGVKNYEIKVGGGGWKEAHSPQPVAKSIFSRNVTVRAFDFYGNFRDANLTVPGFVSSKLLLAILVLLILAGFAWYFWQKVVKI